MVFDSVDRDKRIAKFADESMFVAERTEGREPVVTLLDAPSDPLGKLAQLAQMYQGIGRRSYEQISDRDRLYYIQDMEKNILGMPSEAIQFHFLIENVTRSWTHQLVRTRQASYAQESLRFAVKEDFPCALPPYLNGTKSLEEETWDFAKQMGWLDDSGMLSGEKYIAAESTVLANASTKQRHRFEYDNFNCHVADQYLEWIDEGWPAEDARGALPHWILTKVNLVINLRSLMGMAGQRLCTQAQWEHKQVWAGIINSIREYGSDQNYRTIEPLRVLTTSEFQEQGRTGSQEFDIARPEFYSLTEAGDCNGSQAYERSSAWQYELLARRFQPVCYQTGRCQFRSDFDRYCNIRDRVEQNAAVGRPSSEWHTQSGWVDYDGKGDKLILPIQPFEWARPDAAIRPDGSWRSAEAQENIKGRRL